MSTKPAKVMLVRIPAEILVRVDNAQSFAEAESRARCIADETLPGDIEMMESGTMPCRFEDEEGNEIDAY
jgi:hypothetical protein